MSQRMLAGSPNFSTFVSPLLVYVVVQFCPWFKFLPLFWDMVCMIMSLKQRKIKFKPRIKLNHNIYFILDP